MGNATNEVAIENENLFRFLVSAPIAILLSIFAANYIGTDGLIIMKVIFVMMAVYFTLTALAYFAYYTNDLQEGTAPGLIENENLKKLLLNAPIAISFIIFAVNSIASSSHIVFNAVLVVCALYFTLCTLAYGAFYTNDRFDAADPHH